MADWEQYIKTYEVNKSDGHDEYGDYAEYECVLMDKFEYEVMDYFREYLPTDDCFMDAYLRRYKDGQTRVWVRIDIDSSCGGGEVEREMPVDKSVTAALNEMVLP